LNQNQILGIIAQLYGAQLEAEEVQASTTKTKKNVKKVKKTQAPPASEGDYADYYKRIRAMAKDKAMKDENVVLLLKDRSKGESAYRTVSSY